MQLTQKKARQMGPALSLGDIAKPTEQPWSKTECKRKHRWNTRKHERWCSRCGRREESDPVTREWGTPNASVRGGAAAPYPARSVGGTDQPERG